MHLYGQSVGDDILEIGAICLYFFFLIEVDNIILVLCNSDYIPYAVLVCFILKW